MNERHYDLTLELKKVKKEFDSTKHDIKFENNNKRTRISTIKNKCKIVRITLKISHSNLPWLPKAIKEPKNMPKDT